MNAQVGVLLIESVFPVVEIVLLAIALGLFVPIFVLFVECSAALFSSRTKSPPQAITPRPMVDILIPAHNEASGISTTINQLVPQLTVQDRLLVVADNCDDATASVAKAVGAMVIERQEPNRRGKGYALDYGLQHIAADPPDVVIVVDADCIVHPGAIERLALLASATGRPVQATYLLSQPAQPSPKDAVSALAFMVKNLVRPKGLAQLGLPCLLTGTGMAFPWTVINKVCLASSNIVEDMQLGMDLAIGGHAPMFCLDALVTGALPQQKRAAKTQRTRWEHGHLQTLLTQVPQLLKASLHQKRFDLLALALDLCIPPLSLLAMLWAAAMGTALLAGILGAMWQPAMLLAIEGCCLTFSIVSAWAKFGRSIPILTLLAVPIYILWKIPLYLSFLVRPQTNWIRTERDIVDVPKS